MQNVMGYLGNSHFRFSESRIIYFKTCFDQGTQNLNTKLKSYIALFITILFMCFSNTVDKPDTSLQNGLRLNYCFMVIPNFLDPIFI